MKSEHFSRNVDKSLEDPSETFVTATAAVVFFPTKPETRFIPAELK